MRSLTARSFAFVTALAIFSIQAAASAPVQAFTDNISYNVGSSVQLKIVFAPSAGLLPGSIDIKATLRYAGESKALLDHESFATALAITQERSTTGYRPLWNIPARANTGRYEIDLVGLDASSRQTIFRLPDAASFVVYKKLVRIDALKLDKTFYTSGDPVSAQFTVENLSPEPLTGLRVEFSNRYWPWIAGPADAARASVVTLRENLSLPAGGKEQLHAANVEMAEVVKQPSTRQYGVVVWDRDRKTVLDIAFSPLAFIHPPGVVETRPYSGWYIYPTLSAVNTEAYRHFYPAGSVSSSIHFDHSHTMFAAGGEARADFGVTNTTREPWKGISIDYRILGPDGSELAREQAAGPTPVARLGSDLAPGASSPRITPRFSTAANARGLYRVEAHVTDSNGSVLARETIELAVNPLPKSIMIFCAHEDDEGGYAGLARAAIENHIPIHYVYFTSGDAGSCDVYYQHSCAPADALNFGGLRMDEVRASLGHLGISRDDILFVGLPDGASGQIWYDHADAGSPFLDPLLATDHAPYHDLVQPNLPYARDAVVELVKELIRKYQPEIIATPHPESVGHIDHIVNNYLVVRALQFLAREGTVSPKLTLLVNRVHDPTTQPTTPYHYAPVNFSVSGDATTLAQEAGWYYQSQGGNRQEGNIQAFDKLPRIEQFRQLLDWNDHAGWNEKRAAAAQ